MPSAAPNPSKDKLKKLRLRVPAPHRTYKDGRGITGSPPKSKSDRQNDLDKKFGKREFKLLSYASTTEPAKAKHRCGTIIEGQFDSILRGCTKCPCQHKKECNRTLASYKQEVCELRGREFTVIKFNGIGGTKNTYKHITCGRTYEQSFNSFRLSKHCPHCAGQFGNALRIPSLEEANKRVAKKFDGEFKIVGEYTILGQPALFQHSCGHKFRKAPGDFFRWKIPVCEGCKSGSIARFKLRMIEGVKFKLQGFEPRALKTLADKYGVDKIICGQKNVRRFKYRFKGKQSNYYPDFMIKGTKRVIEVKSLATLGLTGKLNCFFGEDVFERNCAKAKAVTRAGYKFQMRVYDKKKRVKLPEGWFNLQKESLAKRLNVSVH